MRAATSSLQQKRLLSRNSTKSSVRTLNQSDTTTVYLEKRLDLIIDFFFTERLIGCFLINQLFFLVRVDFQKWNRIENELVNFSRMDRFEKSNENAMTWTVKNYHWSDNIMWNQDLTCTIQSSAVSLYIDCIVINNSARSSHIPRCLNFSCVLNNELYLLSLLRAV